MAEQPVAAMGRTAGAMVTRAITTGVAVASTEVIPFRWRLNRIGSKTPILEAPLDFP
jgi:hypothetical protein